MATYKPLTVAKINALATEAEVREEQKKRRNEGLYDAHSDEDKALAARIAVLRGGAAPRATPAPGPTPLPAPAAGAAAPAATTGAAPAAVTTTTTTTATAPAGGAAAAKKKPAAKKPAKKAAKAPKKKAKEPVRKPDVDPPKKAPMNWLKKAAILLGILILVAFVAFALTGGALFGGPRPTPPTEQTPPVEPPQPPPTLPTSPLAPPVVVPKPTPPAVPIEERLKSIKTELECKDFWLYEQRTAYEYAGEHHWQGNQCVVKPAR